jgi:hypothetical protein
MLASSTEEPEVRDPWVTRMIRLPATVVSTTLEGPLNWPNATVASGDAVEDFDLELIENQTLDGNIQELIYRPSLHV